MAMVAMVTLVGKSFRVSFVLIYSMCVLTFSLNCLNILTLEYLNTTISDLLY